MFKVSLTAPSDGRIRLITVSDSIKACSMQLFAPHASQGRGTVSGITFPFDTLEHGVLLHVGLGFHCRPEMI